MSDTPEHSISRDLELCIITYVRKKTHSCFYNLQTLFTKSHSTPENHCSERLSRHWDLAGDSGERLWKHWEKYWFKLWNQQGIHHSFCTFVLLQVDECMFPDFLEKDLNTEKRWPGKERLRRWHGTATITWREKGKRGKKLRGKTDFVSYLIYSKNSTKVKGSVELRTMAKYSKETLLTFARLKFHFPLFHMKKHLTLDDSMSSFCISFAIHLDWDILSSVSTACPAKPHIWTISAREQ